MRERNGVKPFPTTTFALDIVIYYYVSYRHILSHRDVFDLFYILVL